MIVSKQRSQSINAKSNVVNKATTLNPNAAEFVPFSLKSLSSPSGSTSKTPEATVRFGPSGNLGKAVLDRSESSVSNASDEEARQFWHQQLPDDITPDFKDMCEDDSQGLGMLSLTGLSLHDSAEVSRFPNSTGSGYMLAEKLNYATASYGDDPISASFLNLPTKPWDKQMVNTDPLLGNGIERCSYDGSMGHGFMSNINHAMVDETRTNPLEFLAFQFPGFAAESLAEVFVANGCDLNLTVEMLTQLELQVDGSFNQNMSSKALSAPNLSAMDFPALTVANGQNSPPKYPRDDLQQRANTYRSSEKDNFLFLKSSGSYTSREVTDFASAVKTSQDSGLSRSSNVLANSYGCGQVRSAHSDRLQSRDIARLTPCWVETGEAVASMYTELREEARDHARLRNAYFEQARQAYLIGNKALAKELSAKGQLHNMQMKAAHGKAQESIYRQRNPVGQEGRGNEQMIDLHGLHVSEAIHVLKHELNALRSTARLAKQRLQVYILVGTGHHTKGSRTPQLRIAIQQYLLEEEGLGYSEPQPGLLRVVIH